MQCQQVKEEVSVYCVEGHFDVRNSAVAMLKRYDLYSQELVRFVTELRGTDSRLLFLCLSLCVLLHLHVVSELFLLGCVCVAVAVSTLYDTEFPLSTTEHLAFTSDESVKDAFLHVPVSHSLLRLYEAEENSSHKVTLSRYVRRGTYVDVAERVRVTFLNEVCWLP